jgi:hypothetical protein
MTHQHVSCVTCSSPIPNKFKQNKNKLYVSSYCKDRGPEPDLFLVTSPVSVSISLSHSFGHLVIKDSKMEIDVRRPRYGWCHNDVQYRAIFPTVFSHWQPPSLGDPLGIPWGSLGDPRGHRLRFWAAPRQMMVDPCLVNQQITRRLSWLLVFGCFLGGNKTCFTDFAPLTLGSQSTSEHQQTIDEIWSGDFSTDVAMNSLQETLKMIGIWGLSGKPAVTPWDFFFPLAKVDPSISINYSYIVCSSW